MKIIKPLGLPSKSSIKIDKIIKFYGQMNSPLRILGRGNGLTGLWVSSFTFIALCQATRTHELL